MATRKTWRYNPKKIKEPKPELSEELKRDIKTKADKIVATIFKPEHLSPVSQEEQSLNQMVDIYTKWYRNAFYFCSKYKCPANSIAPFFESKFVKFEYLGEDKFQYSYMRHTGKWYPTSVITLEECLERVASEVPY